MDSEDRCEKRTNPGSNEVVDVGAEDIQGFLRRLDTLPTVDSRPADEILGYGEEGLPQ